MKLLEYTIAALAGSILTQVILTRQSGPPAPEHLRVRSLTVIDANGKDRIALSAGSGYAQMKILSDRGEVLAHLGTFLNVSWLGLGLENNGYALLLGGDGRGDITLQAPNGDEVNLEAKNKELRLRSTSGSKILKTINLRK